MLYVSRRPQPCQGCFAVLVVLAPFLPGFTPSIGKNIPAHPPPGSSHTERVRLPYSVVQGESKEAVEMASFGALTLNYE